MIDREIYSQIRTALAEKRKIIVLFGPRQVGKTTLVEKILAEFAGKFIKVDADQLKFREVFSSQDLNKMLEVIGDRKLVFIDEAQLIPNIGINLKILFDNLKSLKIITTGSSAFELANQIKEPLTGRTETFRLYPISINELGKTLTPFELKDQLETFMLYGLYPDVLKMNGAKAKMKHLNELASSYLYKDILQLSGIKHSDKIHKLLKLLSLQVGSLVSTHELGKALGMSHDTVNSYIDLLEKGFIVFRLSGFSRNLHKEVTKMNKVFFYDTGIRNVLAENFNPMEYRTDTGALWENFLIAERMKKVEYQNMFGSSYFWRTYTGAELDYVEERDGKLLGFEFKWGKGKPRPPKTWLETYDNTTCQMINRDNFLEFVR